MDFPARFHVSLQSLGPQPWVLGKEMLMWKAKSGLSRVEAQVYGWEVEQ